tara:strand:- start:299 stop:1495 length:1197 start_codon:yes stop_codon:yes gene_type:complete
MFKNNSFDNLDRVILMTGNVASKATVVDVSGNSFINTVAGSMQGLLYCYYTDKLTVTNNPELRGLTYTGGLVLISGNSFVSATNGLKCTDDTPESVVITNNNFKDCTTAINTDNLSERYMVIGNSSIGDTTFMLITTNSTVSDNNHDGFNGNGQKTATSNATGTDVRVDAAQNGYVEAHLDRRQSSALEDIYYNILVESNDPQNAGVVAEIRAVKDVENASAYGSWELWHGLGSSLKNLLYSSFNGHLLPSRNVAQDNLQDLGSPTIRWRTVYAGTGAIDTSDATEKQQVELLTDKEKAVASKLKGLIRTFKFNDAVELKGESARIHCGIMAQDTLAAFESEGLDGSRYALFCSDTFYTLDGKVCNLLDGDEPPEGAVRKTRLGIRYSQLLAFIVSTI